VISNAAIPAIRLGGSSWRYRERRPRYATTLTLRAVTANCGQARVANGGHRRPRTFRVMPRTVRVIDTATRASTTNVHMLADISVLPTLVQFERPFAFTLGATLTAWP
jgi:hypothetical protein